jgi:hypothetical protein
MTTPPENKTIVLEAFDLLFNKRDYEKAATLWSDTYIQHSAHIPPGREGLFPQRSERKVSHRPRVVCMCTGTATPTRPTPSGSSRLETKRARCCTYVRRSLKVLRKPL